MELRINNPGLKNWILSGPSVFEALQELFFFYCKHQKTYIFRKILFGLVKNIFCLRSVSKTSTNWSGLVSTAAAAVAAKCPAP